jgi:hypothetical protein
MRHRKNLYRIKELIIELTSIALLGIAAVKLVLHELTK